MAERGLVIQSCKCGWTSHDIDQNAKTWVCNCGKTNRNTSFEGTRHIYKMNNAELHNSHYKKSGGSKTKKNWQTFSGLNKNKKNE
jgi:hypothetical protein